MNEAKKYKPLTSEQEKTATKDELVKHNILFAVSVASKYYQKELDPADLVSEAMIGLIKAAETYNPTLGFRFISYAVNYIRRHVNEFIVNHKSQVRYPATIHVIAKKLGNKDEFESIEEFAAKINESETYVNAAMCMKSFISLNETNEDGDEIVQLEGYFNTDTSVNMIFDNINLQKCLKSLTDNEKYVIYQHFYENKNLTNIGYELGITHERVRQLKEQAIKKIKTAWEN